jgi:hypothetical protein
LDVLITDVAARVGALYSQTAWVHVFQSLGDEESAHDLSSVLAKHEAHHHALLEGLQRMIERRIREENTGP